MENFNTIYKQNHRMVLNFIFSKTRNTEVSQELANDVFMKIHDNLSKYDENLASMKTWIMNIANNTIIDYWRKTKLETVSLDQQIEDDANWIYDAISNSANPERKMIAQESIDQFKNVIDQLPKTYVKIAHLFFTEQYSYEEISKTLEIPLGTVKGQLSRVKDILETKNYVMR